MTDAQVNAIRKLQESDIGPLRGNAMQAFLAPYVIKALVSFCEQSSRFALAVVAEGKTVVDCMRKMKLPGRGLGYLSDFEVYRMAAQYFFEGADVNYQMSISLPNSQSNAKDGVLTLRIEDFIFGGDT